MFCRFTTTFALIKVSDLVYKVSDFYIRDLTEQNNQQPLISLHVYTIQVITILSFERVCEMFEGTTVTSNISYTSFM
jgi:hypothetical protein